MSNVFEGFLSTPEAMDSFGDSEFVAAMLRLRRRWPTRRLLLG